MYFNWLLLVAALLTRVSGELNATDSDHSSGELYGPVKVDCPDKELIRVADGLSPEESEWLASRNPKTKEAIQDFLNSANLTDFDVDDFMGKVNDTIKIGLAFSGGGYRAMLNGAGQLLATDGRFEPANDHGLGGLLQASTYLVGLSGGNWLVGTFVLNNYTSVADLASQGKVWNLQHSLLEYGGWNLKKAINYYRAIDNALDAKRDAGFDVSITDVWGRALSFQFFPEETNGGEGIRWSDIREVEDFVNHDMPMPIVVADGRTPNTYIISSNSTVFEINPFELGSWDPSVYQFVDTKYLGSTIKAGEPDTCYNNFDNAGYIMGTSSSLFNQFILQLNNQKLPSLVKKIVEKILSEVSEDENDIAVYKPNPFFESHHGVSQNVLNNDTLFLCDGGEDGQNVPLQPLIAPERELDVIFAYDNSADTDQSWPNGTSLVQTYNRQFLNISNGTTFPYVPDEKSFRNLNLTSRPAFFGCDASNLTSLTHNASRIPPLIVYTANRPFTYSSNTSTFKLSYEDDERDGIIQNGFEAASRFNLTLDNEWRACVACAIVRRTQERQSLEQSEQCKKCFDQYCWKGNYKDDETPGLNFTGTGLTNGEDDRDGDGKANAGFSILQNRQDIIKNAIYGLFITMVFVSL